MVCTKTWVIRWNSKRSVCRIRVRERERKREDPGPHYTDIGKFTSAVCSRFGYSAYVCYIYGINCCWLNIDQKLIIARQLNDSSLGESHIP